MAKLILMKDGEQQIQYKLEAYETVIGRTQESDIIISDDAVSRRHVRIICILGDCFMEDLDSVNGTMLNRRLTKKSPLQDGDIISIGRHDLKYVAGSQDVAADKEDYDKTRFFLLQQLSNDGKSVTTAESMDLGASDTTGEDTVAVEVVSELSRATVQEDGSAAASPDGPPRIYAEAPNGRCGRLILIAGSKRGRELPLIKDVTGIGRSGNRVAAITRRTHGYFLVPLEVDGPDHVAVKANGEPVGCNIYPLCSNDLLEFGDIKMEFSFM